MTIFPVRVGLAMLVVLAAFPAPSRPAPGDQVTEFRGGRWFDGDSFSERTVWVAGDRFATARPARVDTVVDLAGGFVVPPFGEGHNHWLEATLVQTYVDVHLRHGIFYVKDMMTAPSIHDAMRPALNSPTSVDYIAAHQGFTGPGGHPSEIVDSLAAFGILPKEWAVTHGDGDALFVVTTEAQIAAAWPRLVATKPAFVKLFLVHSDEYAARRDNPGLSPKQRGMDPALVPAIVSRAHAANLRVTAHIENAHDFHVAIAAGVDDIAHMPFVDTTDPVSYRLADADIRAAATRRATIATTLEWLSGAGPGDPRLPIARENFERLRDAGVIITIGTDLFRTTARAEADRIVALGWMGNAELLRAWSVATPQAIFPERRLGAFDDGFEASFLVLGGDPIADWKHTSNITRWVKEGRTLEPRATEMPPLEGSEQ